MKHLTKIEKGLAARVAEWDAMKDKQGYKKPGSLNIKKSGYRGAKATGGGVKHVPVDTNSSFIKLKKNREKVSA